MSSSMSSKNCCGGIPTNAASARGDPVAEPPVRVRITARVPYGVQMKVYTACADPDANCEPATPPTDPKNTANPQVECSTLTRLAQTLPTPFTGRTRSGNIVTYNELINRASSLQIVFSQTDCCGNVAVDTSADGVDRSLQIQEIVVAGGSSLDECNFEYRAGNTCAKVDQYGQDLFVANPNWGGLPNPLTVSQPYSMTLIGSIMRPGKSYITTPMPAGATSLPLATCNNATFSPCLPPAATPTVVVPACPPSPSTPSNPNTPPVAPNSPSAGGGGGSDDDNMEQQLRDMLLGV